MSEYLVLHPVLAMLLGLYLAANLAKVLKALFIDTYKEDPTLLDLLLIFILLPAAIVIGLTNLVSMAVEKLDSIKLK